MNLGRIAVGQQLPLIERRGADFPFYNGVPLELTSAQWGLLLSSVVAAFGATFVLVPFVPLMVLLVLGPALSLLIPLQALFWIQRDAEKALYLPMIPRDMGVIASCLVLALVATPLVGAIVSRYVDTASHPVVDILTQLSTSQLVLFLGTTLLSLAAEELLTIIPFLAILTWGHRSLLLSRKRAVMLAWLASSALFGLAHLPVYEWNWIQCIVIIGTARMILTLAYVITKNLWLSTIVHILYDWTLFWIGITVVAA